MNAKKLHKINVINIVVFLQILSTIATADVADWAGRSGFQYLNRSFGVATISRGAAGTALPGSFSRWYNPALYSADSGYSVEFELSRQTEYSERTGAAFDVGFRFKDMFLGLEGSNHTEGGIYTTDDFGTTVPNTSGEGLKWQSSELSLSVGRQRTDVFTWGASIGTAFDVFDGESAYALLFGAGVSFRLIDEKLLFGISALNWGITTPMIDPSNTDEELGEGEALPSVARGGVAYVQPLKNGKIAISSDMVYHHVYDTNHSVKTDINERISYPVGIEYSPIEWVDLRVGKQFNSGISVMNWGLGLNTNWLDFDLGFVLNKFESTTELNWMAGVKFHVISAKTEEVDPYSDRKRAVYRQSYQKEKADNNE